MTDTAISQPATIKDVKKVVAERIRSSFVELMPQDAWEKMVESEIASFTRLNNRRSDGMTHPSDLQEIISEVLKERFLEMLKVELQKPTYGSYFGVHGQEPGTFITQFLKANIDEIVSAMFGGIGQQLLEHVKQAVRNDRNLGY